MTGMRMTGGNLSANFVKLLCYVAGRMGVVRVDMQGVQALKENSQVQAVYVYLGPIDFEEWAQTQAKRCKLMQQNLATVICGSVLQQSAHPSSTGMLAEALPVICELLVH